MSTLFYVLSAWAWWLLLGWVPVAMKRFNYPFDAFDSAFIALPMWALWIVTDLIAFVVGIPLIAVLALLPAHSGISRCYPDRRNVACFPFWGLFSLWENWEDGVDGLPLKIIDGHADLHSQFQDDTWGAATAGWSHWRRVFIWSAFRNSVNNHRFMRPFRLVIDPSQTHIRYFRNNSAYFIWQGVYSALYLTLGKRYLHIGYKFHQDDAEGSIIRYQANLQRNIGVPEHPRDELPADDARRPGAGFVLDLFKPIDPTSWQTPVLA